MIPKLAITDNGNLDAISATNFDDIYSAFTPSTQSKIENNMPKKLDYKELADNSERGAVNPARKAQKHILYVLSVWLIALSSAFSQTTQKDSVSPTSLPIYGAYMVSYWATGSTPQKACDAIPSDPWAWGYKQGSSIYSSTPWPQCFINGRGMSNVALIHPPTCPAPVFLTTIQYQYNLVSGLCERNIPLPCPSNATPLNDTSCTCNAPLVSDPNHAACVQGYGTPLPPLPNVNPDKNTTSICVGNPINPATGLKAQIETDYLSPAGLAFTRVYSSLSTDATQQSKVLGTGGWRLNWQHSVQGSTSGLIQQYRITPMAGGTLAPYGTVVQRGGANQLGLIITAPNITIANVKKGSGEVYTFNKQASGAWQPDTDVNGQLMAQYNTTGYISGWTYTTESLETEQYNGQGQLLSVTDRTGQITTLTYSDGTAIAPNGGVVLGTSTALPAGLLLHVSDPYGRTIDLGYDAQSRIVTMHNPDGWVTAYSYDSNDNLSIVVHPDGTSKQYLYEDVRYPHALTGILDENYSRYATYAYDNTGRAISTEHANGAEKVVVSYNSDGSSSLTDALGTVRTQTFQVVQGVVKSAGMNQPGGSGCGAAASSFTYDANGNIASRTDFNGNKTCYAYDLTRNLETVRVEGLPAATACPSNLASYSPSTATGSVERKISTQWHASLRQPTAVAEPLRLISYGYDVQGNLISLTRQATTDGTGGQGMSVPTNGTAQTITYTYNGAGQILTVDAARTDVADITTYTYDPQGNLASITNALNQVSTLSGYDASGHPGSLTDPNGLITSLGYDARGRLTSRSTGGETTTYSYDGAGQLRSVTAPSGAVTTYGYDAAHRLTDITDGANNRVHYTLDAMGNRTQEQVFNSNGSLTQTHQHLFDALNRLYQDIGAINQTTTYSYDANGNLTLIIDPLSQQTSHRYDALNRLVGSTDAANGNTGYGYDGLNQLLKVTDPMNLVTQYQRDGLGNLAQQISPDSGTTAYTYDAAGNMQSRTDAKNQVSNYGYDALNRLISASYVGAPSLAVSYQYDQGVNGVGHLTQISDATGITQYGYDLHGRLISENLQAQGMTYTTLYNYDPQGRLVSVVYPSGRMVSYILDTLGRISQIDTLFNAENKTLLSNVTYSPFGRVESFIFGDGLTPPVQTYRRSHDQDGRVNSYSLSGGDYTLVYDPASQISSITEALSPSNQARYGYDALSHLTDYNHGAISQLTHYDANGNRTLQDLGGTLRSYGYVTNSNRLASVQTGINFQPITQDANGSSTNDGTAIYSYDPRGRLIQATTAQGVTSYEVNAQGLRVRKIAPYANTDTRYHYDAQRHLIGESNTGTIQFNREYIYLGDQTVAVMQ